MVKPFRSKIWLTRTGRIWCKVGSLATGCGCPQGCYATTKSPPSRTTLHSHTHSMGITDVSIGRVQCRIISRWRRFLLGLSLGSINAFCFSFRRAEQFHHDMHYHPLQEPYSVWLIKPERILQGTKLRGFSIPLFWHWTCCFSNCILQRTQYRSGHRSDAVLAACNVMRRLVAASRWHDEELTFGIRAYSLSDIFWEALSGFWPTQGHLIENLKVGLIPEKVLVTLMQCSCRYG